MGLQAIAFYLLSAVMLGSALLVVFARNPVHSVLFLITSFFTAAGLFVLLGQQAIINVAVNLNLIPTKGMTLPFISYGGSSMLAMGLTLGMALALTRRRPGAYGVPEAVAMAGSALS